MSTKALNVWSRDKTGRTLKCCSFFAKYIVILFTTTIFQLVVSLSPKNSAYFVDSSAHHYFGTWRYHRMFWCRKSIHQCPCGRIFSDHQVRTRISLTERTTLSVEEKKQFDNHMDGLPMKWLLLSVVVNIYMNWFEEQAINTATLGKICRRYVEWRSELSQFLDHINNTKSAIKFTMEKEEDGCLSFLDVLLKRLNIH